jgi:hypothetical protein
MMIEQLSDHLPWLAKLNANARDGIYHLALFGMTVQQKAALEQHIGTILQVMVIGLLGWSLSTTVAMNREMGEFKATIVSLQNNLNAATSDRYRASDATRDHAAIWADIQRADARVTELRDQLNKHKSEVVGMSGVEYRNGKK